MIHAVFSMLICIKEMMFSSPRLRCIYGKFPAEIYHNSGGVNSAATSRCAVTLALGEASLRRCNGQ